MEYFALQSAIRQRKDSGEVVLTPTETLVLWELVDYWNQGHRAELRFVVNVDKVAGRSGLHRNQTIGDTLASLADKGLIGLEAGKGKRPVVSFAPLENTITSTPNVNPNLNTSSTPNVEDSPLEGQTSTQPQRLTLNNAANLNTTSTQPQHNLNTTSTPNVDVAYIGTGAIEQRTENREQSLILEKEKETAAPIFSETVLHPNYAIAYETMLQRGCVPAVAEYEANRFCAWYDDTQWKSHNGFKMHDIAEGARNWKLEAIPKVAPLPPKPRPAWLPPANATQVYQSQKPPAFPDEWQPELYKRLEYLERLDYERHMRRIGWQNVRPPEGTDPRIDRWFIHPELAH